MSDTPKLMVQMDKVEDGRWVRDASVAEVVVWLREQGVGEEVRIGLTPYGTNFIDDGGQREIGHYLVIPLDTEQWSAK